MPKIHGKHTQVLVGPYDPSNWFNNAEQSGERDLAESTGFRPPGDNKQYVAGHRDSTLSLSGQFDGSPDRVDEILDAQLSDDLSEVVTWSPEGLDVGKRARMLYVWGASYGVTAPLEDVVSISVDLQNDGAVGLGPLIRSSNEPALAFDDSPLETDPQDLDDPPEDANEDPIWHGALIHLHVPSNTLDEPIDIIVQHAADDTLGPWVDLQTFTVPAGELYAARVQLPRGTEIDRYVRVYADPTDSTEGSVTFAAVAARLQA